MERQIFTFHLSCMCLPHALQLERQKCQVFLPGFPVYSEHRFCRLNFREESTGHSTQYVSLY